MGTDTRHLGRINLIVLHTVHAETLEISPRIQETKPVAVGKRLDTRHHDMVALHGLHRSHFFSDRLGRMERKDVRSAAIQEITGKTAIETFVQLGRELQRDMPRRSPPVFRPALENFIQPVAIPCRHVLHVGRILQSSLDFQ